MRTGGGRAAAARRVRIRNDEFQDERRPKVLSSWMEWMIFSDPSCSRPDFSLNLDRVQGHRAPVGGMGGCSGWPCGGHVMPLTEGGGRGNERTIDP